MKVTGRLIEDIGAFAGSPGRFALLVSWDSEEVSGMNYICPCGCGTIGELRFAIHAIPRSPTYAWDGNRAEPTITGEISHVVSGELHWRGTLVKGVWNGKVASGAPSPPKNPAGG